MLRVGEGEAVVRQPCHAGDREGQFSKTLFAAAVAWRRRCYRKGWVEAGHVSGFLVWEFEFNPDCGLSLFSSGE